MQVDHTDFIVNNIRIQPRNEDFDIYYDCHIAEVTGEGASPLSQPLGSSVDASTTPTPTATHWFRKVLPV